CRSRRFGLRLGRRLRSALKIRGELRLLLVLRCGRLLARRQHLLCALLSVVLLAKLARPPLELRAPRLELFRERLLLLERRGQCRLLGRELLALDGERLAFRPRLLGRRRRLRLRLCRRPCPLLEVGGELRLLLLLRRGRLLACRQ